MNKDNSDNRGLTLIELIVVVAILGILSFGGMNYFGLLHNASAKETATKLNTAMSKVRTEAMSKSQASLLLYKEDSGYYVKFKVNKSEQAPIQIGSSRVKITYTDSTDAETEITHLKSLTIGYNRETGGFSPIQAVGTTDVYCKKITVTSGSKTYNLICEKLTGKVRVE